MSDLDRFHRQTLLPFVGPERQVLLGQGHALVVGCGAVGCAAAELLVRAGVRRLTLVDRDVVELTNLQRQGLFDEADAREGLPKAEAARRRLLEIWSDASIAGLVSDVTPATAAGALADRPGVILDGTDNYETRYLLNDLSVREGVPLVYAGAVAGEAMSMTVLPGRGPCMRCVFPDPPAPEHRLTCDTSGVFGPAVAIAGAWQAGEALKVLMGREDLLSRRLARFDLVRGGAATTDLGETPDPACPCCGLRRFEWLDRRESPATTLCGRSSVQVSSNGGAPDLEALGARLRAAGEVTVNRFLLRARLREEALEITLFRDGRAIVSGTTDTARARSVVARYIGA